MEALSPVSVSQPMAFVSISTSITEKGQRISVNQCPLEDLKEKEISISDVSSFEDQEKVDERGPQGKSQLERKYSTYFTNLFQLWKPRCRRLRHCVTRSGRTELTVDQSLPVRATKKSGRFTGYRGGLVVAITCATTILLLNVIFIAYTLLKFKDGVQWISTISQGNRSSITRLNTFLHFMINTLTTLLLASSNYTIQLLLAPTRDEIDRAHKQGLHLDIGVLSMRNLSFGYNAFLVGLLLVSSLPVSFLWNSAIFVTFHEENDSYYGFLVTDKFFEQTEVDCSQQVVLWPGASSTDEVSSEGSPINGTLDSIIESPLTYCDVAQDILNSFGGQGLAKIDPENCVNYFSPRPGLVLGFAYTPTQNNFLVVTDEAHNQTVLEGWFVDDFSYLCLSGIEQWAGEGGNQNATWEGVQIYDCQKTLPSTTYKTFSEGNWNRVPDDSCLVNPPTKGESSLQCSLIIMLMVIVCNIVKVVGCILAARRLGASRPLVTIGDAVASFLETSDPTTAGICLADARSVGPIIKSSEKTTRTPIRWNERSRKHRWFHAHPPCLWYATIILSFLSLVALVWSAMPEFYHSHPVAIESFPIDILTSPQGPSIPDYSSNSKFLSMVSIANSAQFIVSVLYFLYNGIYSSIAGAFEWARFTTTRKALRTTEPRGLQRSTYWLSLPWKFAVPLSFCSLLLHWLASEAFHYQRILVVDTFGRATKTEQKASALGVYDSLSYHLLLAFLGAFILYMTILCGFRPLPEVLLVGSNSLAISAACHPPADDQDAALLAVQWGAVRHETKAGPGHCCFTSHEVEMPKEGGAYE